MDKGSTHQDFPCDLCGSRDAIEVPHARLYTKNQPIHICTQCGFVYVIKRRSGQAIADSWSNDIYGDTYTARIPAVKARQTFVADFTDLHLKLKDKLVYDIGTGEGQFLEILRKDYGAKVFGTEASKANCAKLEKLGIPYFCGIIEEFQHSKLAEKDKPDVATITWTLENCVSCREMLNAVYNLVKENGHVVIGTGSRILAPFKKPLYDYLTGNPSDTHSFRFSANTLSALLALSGFQPVHINQYLSSDVMCVIAQKKPAGTKIPWKGDDFIKVHNFFERWHQETIFYTNNEPRS